MLGKKRLTKVHQIKDRFVVCICPPARKLKAVASFLCSFRTSLAGLFDVLEACSVAVVFRVCSIADYEQLNVFV
jgi:hypothetical protein